MQTTIKKLNGEFEIIEAKTTNSMVNKLKKLGFSIDAFDVISLQMKAGYTQFISSKINIGTCLVSIVSVPFKRTA